MNYKSLIISFSLFTLNAIAQSVPVISIDHNPYADVVSDANCVQAAPAPLPGEFIRDFKNFFGPQTSNSLCLLEEGSFEKTL